MHVWNYIFKASVDIFEHYGALLTARSTFESEREKAAYPHTYNGQVRMATALTAQRPQLRAHVSHAVALLACDGALQKSLGLLRVEASGISGPRHSLAATSECVPKHVGVVCPGCPQIQLALLTARIFAPPC